MAIALTAMGLFIKIDQSFTPNAVVICVIIFNSTFGSSVVLGAVPAPSNAQTEAGALSLGYTLRRSSRVLPELRVSQFRQRLYVFVESAIG